MHRRLVRETVLHADETTLQVLKEPGKSAQSKSYMWLYRTGIHAAETMILYEYRSDRKAGNAAEFLKDLTAGSTQTATPATTVCQSIFVWWAAGRTCAGSLMRR